MRLLGLSGSLRKGSYNGALLRTALEIMPEGASLEVATLHGIPLYDGDLEEELGIPRPVAGLKERIAGCDGLLIATPEYNNSIPGVLKNAIDWISRPPGDVRRVFAGKPVALIGASPGGFGTILSQNAWLPVLRTLMMEHWTGGRLMVSRAAGRFAEGMLRDEEERERLRDFLAGFCAFIERARAP